MKKFILAILSLSLVFSTIGPSISSAVSAETKAPTEGLTNNTDLTNEELLNLQIEDVVDNKEIESIVNNNDGLLDDETVEMIEQKVLMLDEEDFLIDEETLAYIDSINPDIDVQSLIDQEEKIEKELLLENDAEALIAPVLIRAAVSAAVAVFRAAGINVIKVSYHVGLRMIQRNISPKQIYDAYTKGTKYSDPDYPKATVYHYKGIAVAREGNTLTTVYNQAKPKSRWKKK